MRPVPESIVHRVISTWLITRAGLTVKSGVYGQTWAQRLKRVFAIDIEKCEKCGGNMKVIASIEDPDVIDKILKHLGLDQSSSLRGLPHNRSPPENMFEHKTTLFQAAFGPEHRRPKHTLNPGHLKSATLGTAGLFYLYPFERSELE